MADFFSYLTEHWYLIPVFIILIILTVFVWIKAIISGQKRKEERERIIAALEKEKALRNEFRNLDEKKLLDPTIDDEKFVFGVAANIQMSIEKLDNMNEVFLSFDEIKQNVYALNYVFEDSKYKLLSDFFRANGQPLTGIAQRAVKTVIGGKLSEILDKMFAMLDDENEETSYDENLVIKLDEEFEALMNNDKNKILKTVCEYIRNNKEIFI